MDYGALIRRPFEIVARRPYLWLLGFLAGGASAFNMSGGGSSSQGHYTAPSTAAVQGYWNGNWEWIVGLLVVVAVIGLVVFALGCIAAGGIIHAAVEHDANRPYRLRTAWSAGYATGWRIAGIRLLTFLLVFAPAVMIATFAIAAAAMASTAVALTVVFGLLAAISGVAAIGFWLVLTVAERLGERAIVLEDASVTEGLAAGFRMLRWHFKEVAFAWLITLVISVAAGVAMAVFAVVAAIVIGIPAAAADVTVWWMGGGTGLVIVLAVAAVFLVGAVLAASGAYSAYSSVYWTLLFNRVRTLPAPVARRPFVSPA